MEQENINKEIDKYKNKWWGALSLLSLALSIFWYIFEHVGYSACDNNIIIGLICYNVPVVSLSFILFFIFGLIWLIKNFAKIKNVFKRGVIKTKLLNSFFPANFFFFISLLGLFIGTIGILFFLKLSIDVMNDTSGLGGLGVLTAIVWIVYGCASFAVFFLWSFFLKNMSIKNLFDKTTIIKKAFLLLSLFMVVIISYFLISTIMNTIIH